MGMDATLPGSGMAAILVEQRSPLVIDEVGLPTALDVGQVLVRLHYSGICGSQIGEIDGVKGPDRHLPHLLGHEGSATVLEVGPGVATVQVGDLVVLHWRQGKGIEAVPPVYDCSGLSVNAGWVTTFNEFAVVSENRCTTVPPETDRQLAALFGCAVTTGFGVVENNARVRAGESVVVYGSGGVGLSIVQAAAMHGARVIIGVDLYPARLELAAEMGATHLIDGGDDGVEERLADILGDGGADVFVDNTGLPRVVEMGYRLTSAKGRVVMVGVPNSGDQVSLSPLPLYFGKELTGSHGGEAEPSSDIPRLMGLLDEGLLKLDNLINAVLPLGEINEAIQSIRSGELAGRCLLAFDED
jgi:S-(hydroxymethyl)glutathione dehydrogenase/alcohol dehydrogenase|tara:strand:- start:1649 stop:2719 length:1071 start_codon:yes stop_codon:yes gene_type:complete